MKSIVIEDEAKKVSELNLALNQLIQDYVKNTPTLFDLEVSWRHKKILVVPHMFTTEGHYVYTIDPYDMQSESNPTQLDEHNNVFNEQSTEIQ